MVMAFVQSKRVVIMAFLRRIVADMADAFAASEIPEGEMPSSRIDVLRMIGKDRIVEETATVSARHVPSAHARSVRHVAAAGVGPVAGVAFIASSH